ACVSRIGGRARGMTQSRLAERNNALDQVLNVTGHRIGIAQSSPSGGSIGLVLGNFAFFTGQPNEIRRSGWVVWRLIDLVLSRYFQLILLKALLNTLNAAQQSVVTAAAGNSHR